MLKKTGGFSETKEIAFNLPIGLWKKDPESALNNSNPNDPDYFGRQRLIGAQMLTNLIDGLNSYGTSFLRRVGNNPDSAAISITEACQQYKDSSWKLSMNLYLLTLYEANSSVYCAVYKIN